MTIRTTTTPARPPAALARFRVIDFTSRQGSRRPVRRLRGLGEAPYDTCPPGMAIFGNPPTCVSIAISGQAAANTQAATQGTCPSGFQLVGNPPFCSPMGAGPNSPCDFGNVYIEGSCYPAGSTESGGVITQPDGLKVDGSTGMVIGSYDWIVSHGGGSTVSTGPAPTQQPATQQPATQQPATQQPATQQPAATYSPRLSFSNDTSGNATAFKVGEKWTVRVTAGKPAASIYVLGGQNGSQANTPTGQTDSSGNFTLSGVMTADEIGTWAEQWSVGGTAAGTLAFTVAAAPAPQQVNQTKQQTDSGSQDTIIGGNGSSDTGGSGSSSNTLSTASQGITDLWAKALEFAPWYVWAAGGAAAGYMMFHKRRR